MGSQIALYTCVLAITYMTTQLLACDSNPFVYQLIVTGGPHIGVTYGLIGNNLPSPAAAVNLFNRNRIKFVRLYDPNPDVLNAFRGSTGILISLGTKNADIPIIAANLEAATRWVNTNMVPYKNSMSVVHVTLGNEVIPGEFAANVAQAMRNMKKALNSVGLSYVKVSTTTAFNLITSYPPSAGAFTPDVGEIMKNVATVLTENNSPLLVSFYPYFAYAANPKDISFEYATFNASEPVIDGPYRYFSLLEAQIDAYYAALAKIGHGNLPIMIAETGWPTAGQEPFTSVANAQTYITNLIKRVKTGTGTPRARHVLLDAFIFGAFDENLKEEGVEQHWGIFSPNTVPKYPLQF